MTKARQQRAAVQNWHTAFAACYVGATVVLFAVLATLYSDAAVSSVGSRPEVMETTAATTSLTTTTTTTTARTVSRWLAQDDNDNTDYSSYSCRYIFDVTPDAGTSQCHFARTCNGGPGVWASFVFCQTRLVSTSTWCWLLSPLMLTWMVMLFRLLGSTAEDYFSPSLEMFSVKLGLPPRFAGVSLLALGNGAADVSATVAAITSDPQHGYLLSLGALSGAAMFITGVLSGLVVLVADGVPCRGALVRDVIALVVTVAVVTTELRSGSIGPSAVSLFLALYVMFVLLVLVADVYHRAVVLPRLRSQAQHEERQRQVEEERLQHENIFPPNDPMSSSNAATHNPRSSTLDHVLAALSNYDNSQDTWNGVESDDLASQPVLLHGHRGLLHHGSPTTAATTAGETDQNSNQLTSLPVSPGRDGGAGGMGGNMDSGGYYSMLGDTVEGLCREPGSMGASASNWSGAMHDVWTEILDHASETWDDIVFNGDLNVVTKIILLLELPFTALRKITVPIPCEGYYVRGMVVLSLAVSPLWLGYYLYDSHNINVLGAAAPRVYFVVFWALLVAAAAALLRWAPGSPGTLSLWIATPIALYGFVIAATWIDKIADALVSLLDFVGIVLHIPAPVVGLTILAWGNSSADLSANVTMARKGLANMAMTACFAGPIFNILVGLGLGFSTLEARTGQTTKEVTMSPSVLTGFLFVVFNGVVMLAIGLIWGGGRIPKRFGYISLSIYIAYLVVGISLQYSKYGRDEEQER